MLNREMLHLFSLQALKLLTEFGKCGAEDCGLTCLSFIASLRLVVRDGDASG